MLIHEFPDIHWLKQQIKSRFENRRSWNGQKLATSGWPTVVLNASAKNIVREDVIGPLSIFTNLSGKSKALAGKKEVQISEDVFFISNVNEPYSLMIEKPVETFNIHIGEQISKEIYYALSQTHSHLIDNPNEEKELPTFHNRLHWRNPKFNSIISTLNENNGELSESECMAELLFYLLKSHQQINRSQLSLDSTKQSTREEISKRLIIAVDYIYSHFDTEISLNVLSAASCISKFHLVRLFKTFYSLTPHQFIMQVRIEKAKSLLKQHRGSVKEIAAKIGFINSSSFSRLFYQNTGYYPTTYIA
jgi:AraC family transcriptional regulator